MLVNLDMIIEKGFSKMQGIGSQYDLIHLTFKFNIPSVLKNIKFDESKIDSSFFI